jgi:hypothetical protein
MGRVAKKGWEPLGASRKDIGFLWNLGITPRILIDIFQND